MFTQGKRHTGIGRTAAMSRTVWQIFLGAAAFVAATVLAQQQAQAMVITLPDIGYDIAPGTHLFSGGTRFETPSPIDFVDQTLSLGDTLVVNIKFNGMKNVEIRDVGGDTSPGGRTEILDEVGFGVVNPISGSGVTSVGVTLITEYTGVLGSLKPIGNKHTTVGSCSMNPAGSGCNIFPRVDLTDSSFTFDDLHFELTVDLFSGPATEIMLTGLAFRFLGDEIVIGISQTPPSNGIPEPATLALFAFGLAGVGLARRRRAT